MKKCLLLLVAVAACSADRPGTADPELHIAELTHAGGNGQTGEVGEPTPRTLKARVRVDGAAYPGTVVYWTTTSGSITDSSVTNSDGVATADWRLGTVTGEQYAAAILRLRAGVESRITFSATARSGRGASITATAGDQQSLPLNFPGGRVFAPLVIRVADRFGNPTIRATVTWAVDSGPVSFVDQRAVLPPDANGVVTRAIVSSPHIGTSTIRATLEETGQTLVFTTNVGAAEYRSVMMYDYDADDYEYGSTFNYRFFDERGIFPATHTIEVGSVFRWENRTSRTVRVTLMNGDVIHTELDIATLASSTTVLNTPGTYTYTSAGFPRAMGTITVR